MVGPRWRSSSVSTTPSTTPVPGQCQSEAPRPETLDAVHPAAMPLDEQQRGGLNPKLGEMIGEETGKITGTRVLSSEGGALQLESSMQATGRVVGVEVDEHRDH